MDVPEVFPNHVIPCRMGHSEGDTHFLVVEPWGVVYVPVPSNLAAGEGHVCFDDHRRVTWDTASATCCMQKAGHVHAHIHRGDAIEDILLEQCLEEAGCAIPMPRELSNMLTPRSVVYDMTHKHFDGCGHNKIAHGDHYDWLVPLQDGSYILSHAQASANGSSKFVEHGRLVKVGVTLSRLHWRPQQVVNVFSYVCPTNSKPDASSRHEVHVEPDGQDEMVKLTIPANYTGKATTKTTFDVMGLCCPAEVGLLKKLLEPLPGIDDVQVNAATKSCTVLHDPIVISDVQIVKILNEARLEASIHQRGIRKMTNKWPSPWAIASGLLLLVAFFGYIWAPLKWVALGAVVVALPPILMRSFVAIRRFILDINTLMLIAIIGAIALGDYVESGSIAFLFTIADWLESRSSDKARDALSTLADLAPQSAVLLDGQRVRVEDVKVGTMLAVKAGELIPIDGEVVSGKSSIDESSMTGESMPKEKECGARVWAGTINLSGYITIRTTVLVEDTAISRMVQLVEDAQNQHSKTEQLVEKFSKYYTPVVVVTALLVAIIPCAIHAHNKRHYLYLALVLLVVACPCALVISAPVTTACGIAQAARAGLLIKGGGYLEALGQIKVVAFDKTGTLTEGHFRVLDVHAINADTDVKKILFWIACVENKSSHPLAPSLVSYARLHGVEPSEDVLDFEILEGEGVTAVVDGQRIHIGNSRMAARLGWYKASAEEKVKVWTGMGATVSWIGANEKEVGVVGVADQLRPEALEAIGNLKKLKVKSMMITGDSAGAASIVHQQIGDIAVHSELLPADKVRLIREFKAIGVTAMVGDGINDAPALAASDVGLAMGVAGSAIAMETADVALMTNDLRKVAAAIRLGRDCRMKIIQNVLISFSTKLAIIVLAACGHPSLWAAVVTDVGTCVVVICNSMRILNNKMGGFTIRKHTQGPAHGKGGSCCSEELVTSKSTCCTETTTDSKCCSKDIAQTNLQTHSHEHHHGHTHEKINSCCSEVHPKPRCCTENVIDTNCRSNDRCGTNYESSTARTKWRLLGFFRHHHALGNAESCSVAAKSSCCSEGGDTHGHSHGCSHGHSDGCSHGHAHREDSLAQSDKHEEEGHGHCHGHNHGEGHGHFHGDTHEEGHGHFHGHHHEGGHTHTHLHRHEEGHGYNHEQGNEHHHGESHVEGQGHFHAENHEEKQGHSHEHNHPQGQGHFHGHTHEEGHGHFHGHNHEGGHTHAHLHRNEEGQGHFHVHNHEQGNEHYNGESHEEGQGHSHGDNHEDGRGHSHGHNHQERQGHYHRRNHEHGNEHSHGKSHEEEQEHSHGDNHEEGHGHSHGHNHEEGQGIYHRHHQHSGRHIHENCHGHSHKDAHDQHENCSGHSHQESHDHDDSPRHFHQDSDGHEDSHRHSHGHSRRHIDQDSHDHSDDHEDPHGKSRADRELPINQHFKVKRVGISKRSHGHFRESADSCCSPQAPSIFVSSSDGHSNGSSNPGHSHEALQEQ